MTPENKARFAKAKKIALQLTQTKGGRDARVERGVYGYLPQTPVITVDVYRSGGSLTRTRIAVGTVDDLARMSERESNPLRKRKGPPRGKVPLHLKKYLFKKGHR